MNRYVKKQVLDDLERKMVFLAGPRQVGKTTLSKSLYKKHLYLNWDINTDRTRILAKEYSVGDLWIFDEIHKYKIWRNYLKGVFDQYGKEQRILVTGSAKLDIFRKSGDSLQGRYHFLRLHPLSLAELKSHSQGDLETLFKLSGFPEPFLSASKTQANRWSKEYGSLLIQHEVASVEEIKDLGSLELLFMRLPDLVGSPLSINSLREDLQVAHKTMDKWLQALEKLYGIFRLSSFGAPIIKAVKKEQKHYHFDWNIIESEGARFENLVACALLKWVHWKNDTEGASYDLRFYRDTEAREVDFIVTNKQKPVWAIEVKLSDGEVSKSLRYFKNKFPAVEAMQISLYGKKDIVKDGIRICPARLFLKDLI